MEKQLTIVVPNASGEEGLTMACKRGELFRNNAEIDNLFRQGYFIENYSIIPEKKAMKTVHPHIQVKVFFSK